MKYLTSLFFIIVLASCSGTKKVVENAPKTETEVLKKQDSMIEKEIQKAEKEINLKLKVIKDSVNNNEAISKNKETALEYFDHNSFDELLKKHVLENGGVNYINFKKDRKILSEYIDELNNNMPNGSWRKEKKLSYWINAYNAMTIDLILRHYPIKSIKDIKNPWEQRHWKLGEKWYNLNDIEHKILRKMDEPRIHFAIVCASISCPKLLNKAFTASNLEEQLTKVTKGFLNDSTKNNLSENNLELSKIFQWFSKDFKQDGSLIDFLNAYSDITISTKAKKSFKDYNWGLNE